MTNTPHRADEANNREANMTAQFKDGWIEDDNGNRCSGEYWLPVPEYKGLYDVSTAGRVRSRSRVNINRNGVRRLLRGKQLRLSCDGEGYPQVGLLRDGVEIKMRVHRVVAAAFIKNPNNLPVVDHKDRDRKHNAVINLRWATYSQNRQNSNPARFHDSNEAAMAVGAEKRAQASLQDAQNARRDAETLHEAANRLAKATP